jgi:hypothetical protein
MKYALILLTLASIVGCGNGTNTSSDPMRNYPALKRDVPVNANVKHEGPQSECDFSYDVDFDSNHTKTLNFNAGEAKSVPINIITTNSEYFTGATAVQLVAPPQGMTVVQNHGQWLLDWKPVAGIFSQEEMKKGRRVTLKLVPNFGNRCINGDLPVDFTVAMAASNDQPTVSIIGLNETPLNSDQAISFQVEAFDPTLTVGQSIAKESLVFSVLTSNPTREHKYLDINSAIKCEDGAKTAKAQTFLFTCKLDNAAMSDRNPELNSGLQIAKFFASVKSAKNPNVQSVQQPGHININFPEKQAAVSPAPSKTIGSKAAPIQAADAKAKQQAKIEQQLKASPKAARIAAKKAAADQKTADSKTTDATQTKKVATTSSNSKSSTNPGAKTDAKSAAPGDSKQGPSKSTEAKQDAGAST